MLKLCNARLWSLHYYFVFAYILIIMFLPLTPSYNWKSNALLKSFTIHSTQNNEIFRESGASELLGNYVMRRSHDRVTLRVEALKSINRCEKNSIKPSASGWPNTLIYNNTKKERKWVQPRKSVDHHFHVFSFHSFSVAEMMRTIFAVLALGVTMVLAQRRLALPDPRSCANRVRHATYRDARGVAHSYFFSWEHQPTRTLEVDWLDARNICRRHCMDAVSLETPQVSSN